MIKYARIVLTGGFYLLRDFPKVIKHSKHPERYDLMDRFLQVKKVVQEINRSSFHAEFLVEGMEDIPEGQVLFVGNHVSLYDPVAMATIIDRPVGFLCKKEVEKMPLASQVAKSLDSTFIDREDLRSEIKAIANLTRKMEKDKRLSYVIFPEGTRSKRPDFELLPFHSGSFKVATKLQIPVVPFAFYLTDRILNQRYHYHRYPVQVRFLKPILPSEYENLDTKQIADIARERIASALSEMKAKDRGLVKSLNGYSDKKVDKILHR
ncbi:MAG TPA: 1-acyl-sn-glycerol-3-phosphate acyltransferase [Candidatus Enterosoma merdigallinarum]|nr:1-acyl-sn-glycerol-3-phosphate acyltransferase [Candidatus Enterosoma merdigallinarum]